MNNVKNYIAKRKVITEAIEPMDLASAKDLLLAVMLTLSNDVINEITGSDLPVDPPDKDLMDYLGDIFTGTK